MWGWNLDKLHLLPIKVLSMEMEQDMMSFCTGSSPLLPPADLQLRQEQVAAASLDLEQLQLFVAEPGWLLVLLQPAPGREKKTETLASVLPMGMTALIQYDCF